MRRILTASIIIASILLTSNHKSEIVTEGEVSKGYVEGNTYVNPYFGMVLESNQNLFGPEYFEKLGFTYDVLEKMNDQSQNLMTIPLMVIPFDKLDVDSSAVKIMVATDTHFSGDKDMFYRAMNFSFEDEGENVEVFDNEIGGIACKTSLTQEKGSVYTTSIIEAGNYYLVIYTNSSNELESEFIKDTISNIDFKNKVFNPLT